MCLDVREKSDRSTSRFTIVKKIFFSKVHNEERKFFGDKNRQEKSENEWNRRDLQRENLGKKEFFLLPRATKITVKPIVCKWIS